MKKLVVKTDSLSKTFKEKQVLKNVNISIRKGEFVCIFGANGCGKTTLLNVIAGILEPSSGKVLIGEKKPSETIIGYVFQNYKDSLLPWKTNLENICFPLELKNVPKKERHEKALELVKSLGLDLPLNNFPYQSSGGEQQLIAFLREVVSEPEIILMDEAFSALNQKSREFLRIKIQEISKKLGLTIVFVTHDLNEAIQLGDKIITGFLIPTSFEKEFLVKLRRPRTRKTMHSKKAIVIEKEIKTFLGFGK